MTITLTNEINANVKLRLQQLIVFAENTVLSLLQVATFLTNLQETVPGIAHYQYKEQCFNTYVHITLSFFSLCSNFLIPAVAPPHLPVILQGAFNQLDMTGGGLHVNVKPCQLHIRLEEEAPALWILVQHVQQVVTLQVSPQVNRFLRISRFSRVIIQSYSSVWKVMLLVMMKIMMLIMRELTRQ